MCAKVRWCRVGGLISYCYHLGCGGSVGGIFAGEEGGREEMVSKGS